MDELKRAL